MSGKHSKHNPAVSDTRSGQKKVARPPLEALFPDGRIYEYFLQRLRLVASKRVQIVQVYDIHDVPDSLDSLPCIEVVLRIVGLKVHNPIAGNAMLATDWLRDHFEGQASQKAFLDALAEYLAASIPAGHPEANLKRKFKHYRDGAPGDLPATADLHVWCDQVVRHMIAAKKWLRNLKRPRQEFSRADRAEFLKVISDPKFWWADYVRQGLILLSQIARQSPKSLAMDILALKFGKESNEAIKSRLYPSRRGV